MGPAAALPAQTAGGVEFGCQARDLFLQVLDFRGREMHRPADMHVVIKTHPQGTKGGG
jgi:hypothetical protein